MNMFFRGLFAIEVAVCFAAITLNLLESSFLSIWGIFAVGALAGEDGILHLAIYTIVFLGWLGFSGICHLVKVVIGSADPAIKVAPFRIKIYLLFWFTAISLNSIPIFIDWEGKPILDPTFTWLVLLPVFGTLHLIYLARKYIGIPS